jgi:hypothetical protein
MTARLPFTAAVVVRAVAAARKAGLDVSAVSVAPDGTVTVYNGVAAPKPPGEDHQQSKWLDLEV